MGPALILFDDLRARSWEPFALTRPAGELRLGTLTLRARAERALGLRCIGQLAGAHLAGFEERDAAPVLRLDQVPRDRPILFLSSRAAPFWVDPPTIDSEPRLVSVGGEVCGWFVPPGAALPGPAFLDDPAGAAPVGLPALALQGRVLERPWDLIAHNAETIAADVAHLFGRSPSRPDLPAGVHRIGSSALVLGDEVEFEPGVVLDLRGGPIWLDDRVRITAFTRLAGPAYVGPDSVLLGGPFSSVSIGRGCKVHGELEEATLLDYSNKAHDGFLGHAYLGSWVNLGALTTNSDLKNNYGTIRLWTPEGEVDSGQIKLGCLLGDHVKTAIGTLLNTGTVVGAGANLFGERLPPKYVPPFTWGTDDPQGVYAMEKFLETAAVVMARRKIELSEGQRDALRRAWTRARGDA